MVKSTKTFAPYDGKRIAVILEDPDGRQVVTGEASYVSDRRLGNALSVRIDDECPEGFYDLFLVESEWNGAILPDSEFGCDCCFIPSPTWVGR